MYLHLNLPLSKLISYSNDSIRTKRLSTSKCIKPHVYKLRNIKNVINREIGLGVWFSLRVREVPGSNPGFPRRFLHFFGIFVLPRPRDEFFLSEFVSVLSVSVTAAVVQLCWALNFYVEHYFFWFKQGTLLIVFFCTGALDCWLL